MPQLGGMLLRAAGRVFRPALGTAPPAAAGACSTSGSGSCWASLPCFSRSACASAASATAAAGPSSARHAAAGLLPPFALGAVRPYHGVHARGGLSHPFAVGSVRPYHGGGGGRSHFPDDYRERHATTVLCVRKGDQVRLWATIFMRTTAGSLPPQWEPCPWLSHWSFYYAPNTKTATNLCACKGEPGDQASYTQ